MCIADFSPLQGQEERGLSRSLLLPYNGTPVSGAFCRGIRGSVIWDRRPMKRNGIGLRGLVCRFIIPLPEMFKEQRFREIYLRDVISQKTGCFQVWNYDFHSIVMDVVLFVVDEIVGQRSVG